MNLQKLTKFTLTLLLSLLLGVCGFAQQRDIKGTVTDKDGAPVAGVTVFVKGTGRSTITNAKGMYMIPASPDETLVFTHVSFANKEVKVADHPTISVQLNKGDSQLDDVIVIGYGTQRLKNVTGAVTAINMAKIADQPVATISEALKGQVPGLSVSGGSQRPGDPPSVSIRQQFNWGKDGGNTNPLIIIDDVIQLDPQTGLSSMDRFNLLDPSEVESITVLRDGASAIYGFRAAQGAIIVKTKRGKTGPPKINYAGKFETDNAVSHGKVMSAYDYGIYANRFGRAAGWLPQYLFSDTELQNMKSLNYDWLGNAWKAANLMQHSLTVSGGADRATYFLGGSYYTQGANMGSQTYNRYTFRGGTDVTVASGLKLSATIAANNFSQSKSFTKIGISDGYGNGSEQNDYNILAHIPKYIPWIYNVNGVDQYVSPILANNKLGTVKTGGSMSGANYFAQLNNGNNTTTKSFGYNANFSAAYEIPFIQGLSVKFNYNIQSSSSNTEQDMFPIALVRANNTNTAGHHLIDSTTTWDAPVVNTSGSRITYSNTTGTIEQMNFFLNYDRNFGNHNISAVVSGEREHNTYDYKFMNYASPVPGVYNGTSATSLGTFDPTTSGTSRSETGTLSYLGRISYNYKSKYLLQFLFRADANSKFAPANYWGFFPTVSAGWVMSDEDWFRNAVPWVNFLKIRGTYGITGNDNVKPWKWEQLYGIQTAYGMGFGGNTTGGYYTNGILPEVSPNPDIKWDRDLQRNIGIDFSVLRSRLTVNIDHYENSISNMLTLMTGAIGVPISAGGAYAEQNYASVKAWGTEITATWRDKIANKVDYTISMNFGVGDNKTTKYFDQTFAYQDQMTTRKQVGQSNIFPQWGFRTWKGTSGGDGMLRTQADMDNYWAYLTDNANKSGVAGAVPNFLGITSEAGLKKGMLVYEDVGGTLDAVNKKYTGPNGTIAADQDYVMLKKNMKNYGVATNLSFSYMGIALSAQIFTSWGGWNKLDWQKQPTSSANMMWAQPIYLNNMYDSTDNPNGKYPNSAVFDGSTSDFWHLPSFRMYVRSLSVGYTLPKKWVTKARMETARLYLAGNNLWDLYNPYPNHYRNMYDAPTVAYPTLRTWALGVNLGF